MVDVQRAVPLLATRDLVLFPGTLAPIFVERDKGVRALEHTQQSAGLLVMVAQKSPATDDPGPDELYSIGTLAKVVQLSRLADGTLKALVEGRERVAIEAFDSVAPLFTVRYSVLGDKTAEADPRLRALMDSVAREFAAYVGQNPQLPEEAETALEAVTDPEDMVNVVAAALVIGPDRKQELLEGVEPEQRLVRMLETLIHENEFIALENEISERVHESFERQQRRVFLAERIKVLQEELGEDGEEASEKGAYLKQLQEKKLPEATAATLIKEIKRLGDLPPLSAEVAVAKTYLDTALGLPWGVRSSSATPDVAAVARVLDETHYGLKSVKDRIIEYLAVASLRGGTPPNTILCLVGPPGVGKTSVAMATAKGLDRPMQRISLGGVRDEGEIRGHRRTYVGAMPGRIIDALKRAGVDDPVIVFDEIDKMESDWRGDPAAALMEVLDPVQNRTFRDNYLELEYDLSHVFFIATANYEEDIPETLHDRLEFIRLPGYTDREKTEIARRHLVPKVAEESGLAELGDVINPAALHLLIREYTREAGVREMARLVGKVYRRLARMKVEGKTLPRKVGPQLLTKLVGPAPFLSARLALEPQVGVTLGLAYTGAGGDVLRIECVVTPGKGDFHLTGQLGEIMQESVTAAWGYLKTSLVRDPVLADLWLHSAGRAYLLDNYQQPEGDEGGQSRATGDAHGPQGRVIRGHSGEPGVRSIGEGSESEPSQPSEYELLAALEVRMHFPEGGVPKEGPSAGIAVATALLSALVQVPVAPKVALSGEITLTGQVLPVGGLKEKLLAALREGVQTVILPKVVGPEVDELPFELKKGLNIAYVENFTDVVPLALWRGQEQEGEGLTVAEVNMAARYEPAEVEGRLMQRWLESGAFRAAEDDARPTYTVPIPPPNVTGSLHMGHALNDTIQDILIRYHRLKGFNTLWVLGTDHAGIATQNKVEARLAEAGIKKEDLGREGFLEKVWEWRREYGSTIIRQMQSLGCAADYENERFTMDEAYQKAVAKVFVSLYEKGDIYRDVYLVNWCVRCGSAISDLEVEHEDRASKLYHVKYPVVGSDEVLVVATTRPETILGDTAVAVNPKDPRYGKLVGGKALVPFVGREVPIIADEHVDVEFGTGALKITPGHDPDDWEIGMRHSLPSISVIGPDGIMTAEAGEFAGMATAEAREAVLRRLEEEGLFVKADDYNHAVGICYRCGTTIEPLLSLQWFMDMKRLAQPAIAAVADGRVRFVPERWRDVYLDWMAGIRPWCISRQLWWGHRVPVYTCGSCENVMVAETAPGACDKCGGQVHQEEDVLDTWFSSALWPFATLGWPEEAPRLEKFYPTSVLSTARDIIYLWVARMIMMGLEFMGDVPFKDVIIHPTVMAADGRRMSKSLGTGVDPLELIGSYGADATRFGLIYMSSLQDVRFSAERIEMGRNFANKIWNASRFVLHGAHPDATPKVELANVADRWIFSRLASVTKEVAGLYESYDFDDVARLLYRFVWNEVCDWYLEIAKSRLYSEDEAERLQVSGNLLALVECVTLLLHPLMPFLSEEIYGNLPAVEGQERCDSILAASYPEVGSDWSDPASEAAMEAFVALVGGLRSTREELGLARDVVGQVRILEEVPGAAAGVVGLRQAFRQLSCCDLVEGASEQSASAGRFASVRGPGVKALLDLEGLVEVDRERIRLISKAQKANADVAKFKAKLGNQGFVAKAPAEVVAEEHARLAAAEALLAEAQAQYRERVGGELPLIQEKKP